MDKLRNFPNPAYNLQAMHDAAMRAAERFGLVYFLCKQCSNYHLYTRHDKLFYSIFADISALKKMTVINIWDRDKLK